MTLTSPNLDDRTFEQLVKEALDRIKRTCPQWTDRSPSDPGMVMLELFAHLTEVMIYRLNRLPEKAYVEFLRLIGVKITPPAAAHATLRFSLGRAQEIPVEIPAGTRVTLERGGAESPVFATIKDVTIEPGETETYVSAHHCELVDAEDAGNGTGLPGQYLTARRPPIIAPTGEGFDLVVGVEAEPEELTGRVRAVGHDGKTFRVWTEVESFAGLGEQRDVFIANRTTGTIIFAPAVHAVGDDGQLDTSFETMAEVPAAGRKILLWYARGGGAEGNVAPNTLTKLKDPIPGVSVTNPEAATGGRAVESLQNALLRGPKELHSLRRAVTASDFELVARHSSGAIARAKAFTRSALWKYAAPGTVEVLLVPYLPEEMRLQVKVEDLKMQETGEALARAAEALDERRPLGTTCLVNWVRYKPVTVKARIVLHRGENPESVREKVLGRLHQTINPLSTPLNPTGWRFGQPLRVSDVYDVVLSEPGVSYVESVRLLVGEAPGEGVRALAADATQARTWYAAAGQALYRTLNDGDGWEEAGRFAGEEVDVVRLHPRRPGLVAISTRFAEGTAGSNVYVSRDCGDTWREVTETSFTVHDAAWMMREGEPVLLLATDLGLYELNDEPGAIPVHVLVDPANPKLGFYAVAASAGFYGTVNVALAARGTGGVYLSRESGRPRTFRNVGLQGEAVHVLEMRRHGDRSSLWAGVHVAGFEAGRGCFSLDLAPADETPAGWVQHLGNWKGGSCLAIAFQGEKVFAGTFSAGVLTLDTSAAEPQWEAPSIESRLPARDVGRFQPVEALAVEPKGRLLMAGGPAGVYRSADGGATYEPSSGSEFLDKVALPETRLFCSGEHEVTVVSEDEGK